MLLRSPRDAEAHKFDRWMDITLFQRSLDR
jgi:L-amino acid N-acyltransferase YncA